MVFCLSVWLFNYLFIFWILYVFQKQKRYNVWQIDPNSFVLKYKKSAFLLLWFTSVYLRCYNVLYPFASEKGQQYINGNNGTCKESMVNQALRDCTYSLGAAMLWLTHVAAIMTATSVVNWNTETSHSICCNVIMHGYVFLHAFFCFVRGKHYAAIMTNITM